jgi:Mg-chelatase subunit ChlD
MGRSFGLVGRIGSGLVLALAAGCGSASMAAAPESVADRDPGGDYAGARPMEAMPYPQATATPEAGAPGLSLAAPSADAAPAARLSLATGMTQVKAGEWDDNANYRDFTKYIGQQGSLGIRSIDVSSRRFLVVEDAQGQGVPSCKITVRDSAQGSFALTTAASGRAILFPRAAKLSGAKLVASTSCLGKSVSQSFDLTEPDGEVTLKLAESRKLGEKATIEVVFVLDSTGSMSEEIQGVKDTLQAVVGKLDRRAKMRVGLVEYKDKGDELVTRTYPMTTDLASLSAKIAGIEASGGGDIPENVNAGLAVAISQMQWSEAADARVAFLIADAPPHLDYDDVPSYDKTALEASKKGIKLFTVSASGMDDLGQAVFRQVAQVTGGTNMFVLRGGAGPQSTGGGDPKAACGGTHQNFSSGALDDLIVNKIRLELASLKASPHRIPGLFQDEDAKPCAERVQLVAE